jgi:hypothetical protein
MTSSLRPLSGNIIYSFRLAAAPALAANTIRKATRRRRWKVLTLGRLVSNNYSYHYGSQSPTSPPILAGRFHFRPLVSHCSTGPQKIVLMPGLSFSDIRHGAMLIYYRRIDLANATCDELEQLVGACEHTSSDVDKNAMTDEPAKMGPGSFAPLLVPVQTDLAKVVRDYHLEGDKGNQRLKMDLRELNVYSTHPTHSKPSRHSSHSLT